MIQPTFVWNRTVYWALTTFLALIVMVVTATNKDYYKILGVEKSADDHAIKKAFRKKAIKYHPDKPEGSEEKFRELAEAYDVLGNPDKRRQYDQLGSYNENVGDGGQQHFYSSDFNFDEFFRNFDESLKEHMRGHQKAHRDAHERAHAEATGKMFNLFDGLWDFDQDDEIFKLPHFGFGDIIGQQSILDGFANMDMQSSKSGGRQSHTTHQHCHTVTQKIGDAVRTYTKCTNS